MANAFYPTGGRVGASFMTTTSDNTNFPALGDCVTGNDGTMWVRVQASGAIAQYDCVAIDEDFTARAMTKAHADDGHKVGFAQVAFSSGEYGYVACGGAGSDFYANVLSSCAADVALYTTATPGKLDETSTSQTEIKGVVAVAANATATVGAVNVIATFPRVDL